MIEKGGERLEVLSTNALSYPLPLLLTQCARVREKWNNLLFSSSWDSLSLSLLSPSLHFPFLCKSFPFPEVIPGIAIIENSSWKNDLLLRRQLLSVNLLNNFDDWMEIDKVIAASSAWIAKRLQIPFPKRKPCREYYKSIEIIFTFTQGENMKQENFVMHHKTARYSHNEFAMRSK